MAKKAITTKRVLSILLTVILSFSLTIPAYAASADWTTRIKNFTRVSSAVNSTSPYVKILQRFLVCYNDTTNQYIINGGGVDGIFGQKADQAVREFQSCRGLVVDGDCGANTWGQVAACLSDVGNTYNATLSTNSYCPRGAGSNVIQATYGIYSSYSISTYDEYGTPTGTIVSIPV